MTFLHPFIPNLKPDTKKTLNTCRCQWCFGLSPLQLPRLSRALDCLLSSIISSAPLARSTRGITEHGSFLLHLLQSGTAASGIRNASRETLRGKETQGGQAGQKPSRGDPTHFNDCRFRQLPAIVVAQIRNTKRLDHTNPDGLRHSGSLARGRRRTSCRSSGIQRPPRSPAPARDSHPDQPVDHLVARGKNSRAVQPSSKQYRPAGAPETERECTFGCGFVDSPSPRQHPLRL